GPILGDRKVIARLRHVAPVDNPSSRQGRAGPALDLRRPPKPGRLRPERRVPDRAAGFPQVALGPPSVALARGRESLRPARVPADRDPELRPRRAAQLARLGSRRRAAVPAAALPDPRPGAGAVTPVSTRPADRRVDLARPAAILPVPGGGQRHP